MDPGPRPLVGQPHHGLPHIGAPGVPVHDHHGVRPVEGSVRPVLVPRPGGPPGRAPYIVAGTWVSTGGRSPRRAARFGQVVLQTAEEFVRAGRRLLAVVGEEEAAVLAVRGAQVGEPAEPGPLGGALLDRAGTVRADQDDFEGVGGVQRGELRHERAGQPREARTRPGQTQRAGLPQAGGHRHRGQQARAVGCRPVGRAQPYRQCLRVPGAALPQPRSRPQCGEQQRRGVGPALRRLRHRGEVIFSCGFRVVVRVLPGSRRSTASCGQSPRPGADSAPPAHARRDVRAARGSAFAGARGARACGVRGLCRGRAVPGGLGGAVPFGAAARPALDVRCPALSRHNGGRGRRSAGGWGLRYGSTVLLRARDSLRGSPLRRSIGVMCVSGGRRDRGVVGQPGGGDPGVSHARVGHGRGGRCRPRASGAADIGGTGPRTGADGHPHMPLPVRRLLQRPRSPGRSQPQRGLADTEEGPGGEADGAGADAGAVECRAVRGTEVGDRDAALRGDRDRAVQAGDVGVVQRHVRVGGAADVDLAAVQEVDAARVGARDHMELGGAVVRVRAWLRGRAQGQHGAVRQGRLAQRAALPVEPLSARVQHDLAVTPADRRGQARRDRGQRRAGGRGDQHIAGRGTPPRLRGRPQRVYDGQPDLHRRQRSLPRRCPRRGRGCAAVPHRRFPHRTRARRPVLEASSHLPLTTRPPPTRK